MAARENFNMNKKQNNYAFIDSHNLVRGVQSLGWHIDWFRFRVYLKEKYGVTAAYLFLGFLSERSDMYDLLQKAGFILKFKPIILGQDGKPKGNTDADMVLQAMIDIDIFERALIVTSDGDFYSLVRHLYEHNKLLGVLSPRYETCSQLLKKEAKEKIYFLNTLKEKLAYKKKSTA